MESRDIHGGDRLTHQLKSFLRHP